MWWCNLCSLKTSRRGNVIRHIREIHGVEDPNAQNATKDSNTGVKTKGKDKTTKVSNGEQPRMLGSEIPLSEERYSKMNSPKRMTDLQDEGHLPEHQPRMYEEYERHQPISNPVNGQYSSEEIEKFGDDMRRKKCHILDCVLDTFPEHLKTKAKSMCDSLKCKDRLFILPSHEILIEGGIDRVSNIRDYIMDSLIEPLIPGKPKIVKLEKENERLKRNLAYYEKALARARGVLRCRKFESIIDGTIDCCDFCDDTNSDESSDGDDDTDENQEDDEDEYEDDEEDEEDDMEEDDDEEYKEDDEASRTRRRKID